MRAIGAKIRNADDEKEKEGDGEEWVPDSMGKNCAWDINSAIWW